MNDREHAKEIQSAAAELNVWLAEAARAGLRVQVEALTANGPAGATVVEVKVERPL